MKNFMDIREEINECGAEYITECVEDIMECEAIDEVILSLQAQFDGRIVDDSIYQFVKEYIEDDEENVFVAVEEFEDEDELIDQIKVDLEQIILQKIRDQKEGNEKLNVDDVIDPVDSNIKHALDKPLEKFERYTSDKEKRNYKAYENYFEYISSPNIRKQLGNKKKTDKRSDEIFMWRKLSWLTDNIIQVYNSEKDEFKDYTTVKPEYMDQKIYEDRLNKKQLSINESAEDTVEKAHSQYEIHINNFNQYQSQAEIKQISKREMLRKRKKLVKEIVNEHKTQPNFKLFKQMFDEYTYMGLKYGFSMSEYTKEERKEIQEHWLKQFSKERHNLTPKKRMFELKKHYNQMGMEIENVLISWGSNVKHQSLDNYIDMIDYKFEKIDLGNPEHVFKLLLKIDYKPDKHNNDRNYLPFYTVLWESYKDRPDTSVHNKLTEVYNAMIQADLDNMQRDMVKLIINIHNDFNIYLDGIETDPYKRMAKYINESYRRNSPKLAYIKMLEGKIAKTIAKTYTYIIDGVEKKKCTKCEIKKFAVKEVFGEDKRNKDNLKSICKLCQRK